jgi:hypothetical protein
MKTLLLLSFSFCVGVTQASAQGTVWFENRTETGNALVFMPDCVTPVFGDGFQAQLYAGSRGSSESALLPIAPSTPFRSTPAGAAGLWVGIGLTVPSVPPFQTAVLQARVWETAAGSYENAVALGRLYGASGLLQIVLGDGQLPGPPPLMNGLQSFCLVPEPSTLALALFGAVFLGYHRCVRLSERKE